MEGKELEFRKEMFGSGAIEIEIPSYAELF
jgi:hypothetical protein